jgi:S1-C subfamily serine protease
MLHSAGRFLLFLSVVLTSCATVRPSPRNLSGIAAKVQAPGYSGSAFKYRGRIVTAGHVCEYHVENDLPPFQLYYVKDGKEHFGGYFVPDTFIMSGAQDACLLMSTGAPVYLPLEDLQPAPTPRLGDAVSVLGAPYGHTLFRTDGYVAAMNLMGYIGVSASSAPGNSGGPVVDSKGRLIGLLTAGMPIYEHISLVTPRSVLDELFNVETSD